MNAPLVSILIPSYNHAEYLRERIESIVNQTYTSYQLIVIDDMSNDESDSVLKDLNKEHDFKYLRNDRNSGTPFSAWEKICDLAEGKYIWICESDDVAENTFLETAIKRFDKNPSAVLFYSHSSVIDENSEVIGNTMSYFNEMWHDPRWNKDFSSKGDDELAGYQVQGQTVPNMSSALIKADIFRKAYSPYLKKLKLTGDWLFIGEVMQYGDIEFSHKLLSRFRKHEVTSRVRVLSARSQAEFILTKYRLFRISNLPRAKYAQIMGSDAIRFLYEPASIWALLKELFSISAKDAIACAFLLLTQVLNNPEYFKKFSARYKHAKEWRKNEF